METENRVITEEQQLQEFIGEFVKDFGPGAAKEISAEMQLQARVNALEEQAKYLRAQNFVMKCEKATAEQRVEDLTYKLRVRKREIQQMNQRLMIHSLERKATDKYMDATVEDTLVKLLEDVRARKAAAEAKKAT